MKRLWLCVLLAQAFAVHAECGLSAGWVPFEVMGENGGDVGIGLPRVQVIDVARGLGGGKYCDRMGLLILRVESPKSDVDLGLEFRIVSPDAPSLAVFPAQPVAIGEAGQRERRGELVFMWQDEDPVRQTPLRLEVEVRAVTRDARRGAPLRFSVDQARFSD